MLGNTLIEQNKLSNYLSVFSPSACDILGRHSTRAQMSEFGGISKTLTISRLNFIDTCLNPKTGRSCDATAALSAPNRGPFANSAGPEGKTDRLFR